MEMYTVRSKAEVVMMVLKDSAVNYLLLMIDNLYMCRFEMGAVCW